MSNIIQENSWESIICNDGDLLKLVKSINIKTTERFAEKFPLFVGCEHLIAENGGSVMFLGIDTMPYERSKHTPLKPGEYEPIGLETNPRKFVEKNLEIFQQPN